MGISNLKDIRGNHWIFRNNDYVVLVGKKLWIFELDGTPVACRADIPHAYKVAFLPGNRLLTGGGKCAYHMLSLKDGSELWCIPQKQREFSAEKFALSPDGAYAYDYYYWKDKLHFVRIDLMHATCEEYLVSPGLRATKDVLCDEQGIPCLLQTQYSNIAGKQLSENGILYQYQDDVSLGNSYYWKHKWQFDGKRIAKQFLGDTETIITNDLYVYNPKTEDGYYLLENDIDTQLPDIEPNGFRTDYSGQYIVLMYDTVNIVVDWKLRKVVARYAGEYTEGCLVRDQFWISTTNGIQCNSFPSMEDIPLQKYTFLNPYQSG